MLVQSNRYRLDGLGNGFSRFLSDEQRSRMRTRCWAFLDDEDDVVGLSLLTRLWFVTDTDPIRFSTATNL